MITKFTRVLPPILAACMVLCLSAGCSGQPAVSDDTSAETTDSTACGETTAYTIGISASSEAEGTGASDSDPASSSGGSTKKGPTSATVPPATASTSRTSVVTTSRSPDKPTTTASSRTFTYEDVTNVIRSQATSLRLTKEALERAIVNEGNAARIANVIKKAVRGEEVTIGFIGGSITEGAASSSTSKNYAGRFQAWWSETFPNASISICNAGMGATDSLAGVHRVESNLLARKPDLVIVEFSVNDSDDPLYRETYEGLLRRILKQSQSPGVICLFMMDEQGVNRANLHQAVGEHYDLPIISYQEALWPKNGSRLYQWSELSPDSIHPNDTGHAIVSELLIYYINTVREKLTKVPETVGALPAPLTANGYENAQLLNGLNLRPSSFGSFRFDIGAFQFGSGWTTTSGSQPIVFEINDAKNIFILYKASVDGTGASATVRLDGKNIGTIHSDFSGGWGDYAATFPVLQGNTSGKHTLEIQVNPSGAKTTFSILGILKS